MSRKYIVKYIRCYKCGEVVRLIRTMDGVIKCERKSVLINSGAPGGKYYRVNGEGASSGGIYGYKLHACREKND